MISAKPVRTQIQNNIPNESIILESHTSSTSLLFIKQPIRFLATQMPGRTKEHQESFKSEVNRWKEVYDSSDPMRPMGRWPGWWNGLVSFIYLVLFTPFWEWLVYANYYLWKGLKRPTICCLRERKETGPLWVSAQVPGRYQEGSRKLERQRDVLGVFRFVVAFFLFFFLMFLFACLFVCGPFLWNHWDDWAGMILSSSQTASLGQLSLGLSQFQKLLVLRLGMEQPRVGVFRGGFI